MPTKAEVVLLDDVMLEYVALVNDLLDYSLALGEFPTLSSSNVIAKLPSALKNQCIRDAASVWHKTFKNKRNIPTLKKPAAIWNNQNYSIENDRIGFPVWLKGKSQKIYVKAIIPKERLDVLCSHKLGTLRITKKNGKYIAQINYQEDCLEQVSCGVMGIDMGLLCPAVSVTDTGATRFYGNGRRNKYVRRYHKQRRRKLGKAKKLSAIRKSKNKEQRWMIDQDHKVSCAIVDDAVRKGVSTIKLEALSGIRSTARTSRKHDYSLHNWSFYRLASFIEYKANMKGIKVIYIDPKYTSQTCPICGKRHKASGRDYKCPNCGYHTHRDRVGAVNICHAA